MWTVATRLLFFLPPKPQNSSILSRFKPNSSRFWSSRFVESNTTHLQPSYPGLSFGRLIQLSGPVHHNPELVSALISAILEVAIFHFLSPLSRSLVCDFSSPVWVFLQGILENFYVWAWTTHSSGDILSWPESLTVRLLITTIWIAIICWLKFYLLRFSDCISIYHFSSF